MDKSDKKSVIVSLETKIFSLLKGMDAHRIECNVNLVFVQLLFILFAPFAQCSAYVLIRKKNEGRIMCFRCNYFTGVFSEFFCIHWFFKYKKREKNEHHLIWCPVFVKCLVISILKCDYLHPFQQNSKN